MHKSVHEYAQTRTFVDSLKGLVFEAYMYIFMYVCECAFIQAHTHDIHTHTHAHTHTYDDPMDCAWDDCVNE